MTKKKGLGIVTWMAAVVQASSGLWKTEKY
jgi:hypothetical protein